MPSFQTITSCLQHLVESPTLRRRARHSNRPQKSSNTSASYTPFSPRIAFLEPIDYDRDTTPLLNASRSNTPSMLSAVTTGGYSLTNTPSIPSSVSFAKSETYRPVLPALPFTPPNTAEPKSNCDSQSEARPFVNVHKVDSYRLDFSAEAFRLTEHAVDEEAAKSIVLAEPKFPILEHPNSTERGGKNSKSAAQSAYYSPSSYHESPNSPVGPKIEKDEHEIYLDKLKRLHFGDTTESTGIAANCLSNEFSLSQQGDDDAASWEEIDLRNYGWVI